MGDRKARKGWPALGGICAPAILGALVIATSGPVPAQPRISEDWHLRIASWDLRDAMTAGVIARPKPVTRSWRNTFGAERRVEAKPTFAADRLKADIVLLQGVRSVRQVRQIFPARDWKLIFSRQILKLGDSPLSKQTTLAGERTITAAAVRYQTGLRITRIEHLSDLDGSDGAVAQRASPADSGEPFPDVLGLRLSYSGSIIWVVSALLPPHCRIETEICLPAARLRQWADGKRAEGVSAVIGGQLDPSLRQAGPRGVCANQEIVADRNLQAVTGADTVAGCVVFVDVGGKS